MQHNVNAAYMEAKERRQEMFEKWKDPMRRRLVWAGTNYATAKEQRRRLLSIMTNPGPKEGAE